jgi:hypothetical protein
MPTRKKTKSGDDVFEVFEPFVRETADGPIVYRKGQCLPRRDVEKIRGWEQFFKPFGAPDPARPEPPEYDDAPVTRILKQLPESETVVCPEGLVAPHDGVLVGIQAGERVPRNHPLVKRHPDRFELS